MKSWWWTLASVLGLWIASMGTSVAQEAEGEITRLDKTQGRLTLRHGEIKSLEMPPMTMVFRVRDPKMLEPLSVGDKVRFSAEKIGGHYTVTVLVKAP